MPNVTKAKVILMNVYDFDNTIYDGESLVDFFIFCIMKKKSLIIYLPLIVYTAILYKLNSLPIDKLYRLASKMSSVVINNKQNADLFIKEFWNKNEVKLKSYYLDKLKATDIIITASPRLLIEGITDKLKTKNIICSEFNLETGKFEFIWFRENKVVGLKNQYPDAIINEFYTDSLNDIPLMKLAKKVYLVKGDKLPKLLDSHIYR